MILALDMSNVVIVSNSFNVSIFSQIWLIKNGIMNEDDFSKGYLFSPMAVQTESNDFSLLVVPERLQFTLRDLSEKAPDLIMSKVGKIVETLPHTPFKSVGLNFNWCADSETQPFDQFNHSLFWKEKSPLYEAFNQENARFGAYMSQDFMNFRLKLDIKPITRKTPDGTVELLQFAFNFHRDLEPESAKSQILDTLKSWSDAKKTASEIISKINSEV